MPKKLNIDEVKQRFLDKGLILDDSVYKNRNTKMNCHDKDGYKYYISLGCVCDERTNKFAITSKSNKWSIFNIQHFIDLNGGEAQVISDNYISEKNQIKIKCKCGKTYNTTWNRLLTIHKFTCTECGINRRAYNQKIDKELIFDKCNQLGFDLLNKNDSDMNTHNLIVCDKDGYKYKTTIYNLMKSKKENFGDGSVRFSVKNPFQLENMRKYLSLNDFEVKLSDLVVQNFNARDEYVDFICKECKQPFKSTWSQTILNKRERCLDCVGRKSNLEYAVEEYLKQNNIEYIYQKRFDGCKNKRLLPFDFYLIDYNVIIEVQGSQHFYENDMFEQTLKERQEIDKIKKDFCITNNIGYLAIPFWHIENSDLYKSEINNIIGLN